ncbi:MAG: hypothetical protein JO368_09760 [Acidimicrobiales bacterium]|nr:hypothetical protein [Acidimicrobiales bacterium]
MPQLRGLDEVRYQFDRPFRLDSSAFSRQFGVEPTPIDDVLDDVLAAAGRRPATVAAA